MVWLIAAVDTTISWADKDYSLTYRGHNVLIRTATDRRMPAICIEHTGSMNDAHKLARELMSELVWVFRYKLAEVTVAQASHCMDIGPGPVFRNIGHGFSIDYLPEPNDANGKLALAYYREATSVNSTFYSFLGYWKIASMLHQDGTPNQTSWLITALGQINEQKAVSRINELKAAGITLNDIVTKHLYGSRRCAIAHATTLQRVNPDDPAEEVEIAKDLPVIKAIAEHAIEYEFGIKSSTTIWKEHLYELEGFRTILGQRITEQLKAKQSVIATLLPELPKIDIRLADKPQVPAFQNWRAIIDYMDSGILHLTCIAANGLLTAKIRLNFTEERLDFHPWDDVKIKDDGSPVSAQLVVEHLQFWRDYFLNGRLEIYDSITKTRLSRKEAYLPCNVDHHGTLSMIDTAIDRFKAETIRRSQTTTIASPTNSTPVQ